MTDKNQHTSMTFEDWVLRVMVRAARALLPDTAVGHLELQCGVQTMLTFFNHFLSM